MTDPVPGEAQVVVRLVLAPGDASLSQVRPELLPAEGEKRPDDAVGTPLADAPPVSAGVAGEVQQDGFGLVVERVSCCHERSGPELRGGGEEGRVTEAARCGLQALALPAAGRDVGLNGPEGEAERPGKTACFLGVPFCSRAADEVPDVDGEERPPLPRGERREQVRERGGVAAARHCGDHMRGPPQEPYGPEVLLETEGERLGRHGKSMNCPKELVAVSGFEPPTRRL